MISFLPAHITNEICNERINLLEIINKVLYFVIENVCELFH